MPARGGRLSHMNPMPAAANCAAFVPATEGGKMTPVIAEPATFVPGSASMSADCPVGQPLGFVAVYSFDGRPLQVATLPAMAALLATSVTAVPALRVR